MSAAGARLGPGGAAALLVALVLAGCGGDAGGEGSAGGGDSGGGVGATSSSVGPATSTPDTDAPTRAPKDFPDVEQAELTRSGDGYDLAVTISSAYDSPQRYADGWRVLTLDGEVIGRHELLHDHADEQPFTRTQSGLQVPAGVDEVVVEGRDSVNGYGGTTVRVPVP